jgi:hypothetical protein
VEVDDGLADDPLLKFFAYHHPDQVGVKQEVSNFLTKIK